MRIGPEPRRDHETYVTEVAYYSEPASDRPEWGPGATHTYRTERSVRTVYGPWLLVEVDGRPLPEGQSKWDGLFYKGDGSPGTEKPEQEPIRNDSEGADHA